MGCSQGWPACKASTCTNCLAVHDGTPGTNESNSGWTFTGLRQGRGLAAATGGRSAFELLPGICKRYEQGQLTNEPLWPWPMDARIKAARASSGARPLEVTAEIEQALGPIPAACKTGGGPPPGDTIPPTVVITAPSHGALVSGTAVAVAAEATDNVGVVSISFLLDEVPCRGSLHGRQRACAGGLDDSGQWWLHKLRAVARDAAGNLSTGNTIDITVYNSVTPPEPQPGGHPALACTGAIEQGGTLSMRCEPEATQR